MDADTEDYLVDLEERLFKASEFARRHLHMSWQVREKNCAHHGRSVKPLDLNRPVYVFNPAVAKGRTPKLARMWKGPFMIVEQLTELLYRIQLQGRGKTQVVHRSHLYQPEI